MGAQRLINLGFHGYQGWGDAEAEANFKDTGGSGKGGPSAPSTLSAPSGPSAADRTAFNERASQTTSDFLGRFKTDFPQVLTGLETQLGLPGLRETATSSVGALGDIANIVKSTPGRTTQAAKGFDVSASQLERQIAAETAKLQPTYQEATSAAQQALTAAQLGEQAFGTRAELALKPFETEIGMLKDQLSREATGFNIDVQGRLDTLLEQIQQEGATNIANIEAASDLAQLEADKDQYESTINTVDLGNRVVLLDKDGNQVGSFAKGKLPTSGSGSDWI